MGLKHLSLTLSTVSPGSVLSSQSPVLCNHKKAIFCRCTVTDLLQELSNVIKHPLNTKHTFFRSSTTRSAPTKTFRRTSRASRRSWSNATSWSRTAACSCTQTARQAGMRRQPRARSARCCRPPWSHLRPRACSTCSARAPSTTSCASCWRTSRSWRRSTWGCGRSWRTSGCGSARWRRSWPAMFLRSRTARRAHRTCMSCRGLTPRRSTSSRWGTRSSTMRTSSSNRT